MSGSSNILAWNPGQNNQEDDGDYLLDSQRVNGAANPSIFPSDTANKLFFQLSQVCSQLCAALAAKGYTILDTTPSTILNTAKQLLTLADLVPTPLAFSATPVFDCSLQLLPTITMTLTGNITSMTVENFTPGQRVTFVFTQDGTGGRTVAWSADFVGAAGAPDPTPGAVSIQEFLVTADNKFRPLTPMTSS